jgi:hypothetical protein
MCLDKGRVDVEKESNGRRWGNMVTSYWDLREFYVLVNIPVPVWQVQALAQWICPLIWGIVNPNWHIITLISHIPSYPPHCSQLLPLSCFLSINCTITTELKVQPSFSIFPSYDHVLTPGTAYPIYSMYQAQHKARLACIKYSRLHVQHIQSTSYTHYNIHLVQYTPSTAYT